MSRELHFYKVKKIDTFLPEVLDADKEDFPYQYKKVEDTPSWFIPYCKKRKVKHTTIDYFKACEEILGSKIDSLSHLPSGRKICYFEGKLVGNITAEQLEPYYYVKEEDAYVYQEEYITSIENTYMILDDSMESGITSLDGLYKLIKKCIDHNETYYAAQGKTLYDLCKVLLLVRAGENVFHVVE